MGDSLGLLVGLLLAAALLIGAFWGADLISRRLVKHPAARFFLTAGLGLVFLAILIGGLVAGCVALLGSPNYH